MFGFGCLGFCFWVLSVCLCFVVVVWLGFFNCFDVVLGLVFVCLLYEGKKKRRET